MNLFEMFNDKSPEALEKPSDELKSELNMIIQKYGLTPPAALLDELSSLYKDPPPWNPW